MDKEKLDSIIDGVHKKIESNADTLRFCVKSKDTNSLRIFIRLLETDIHIFEALNMLRDLKFPEGEK